jgi:hypothetical protein
MMRVAGAISWRTWPTVEKLGSLSLVATAFLITVSQILLACVLAGGHSPREAYERLYRWDGGWYASIINNGYLSPRVMTSTDYGNVGFFPGYPLAADGIKRLLGLSSPIALLFAAQLACWSFWTYLLLFFARWQLPTRLRVLGVLLIVSHPAAFFLIASYSESLFLTGLLGFLYWCDSPRPGSGWIAAAHGFVMTATRLVGVPVVIFPLCQALFCGDSAASDKQHSRLQRHGRAMLLGAAASLGAILFFAYCHFRFGAWDTYMQTGHYGWNITPDYSGLFSLRIFKIHFPSMRDHLIDGEFFSRLSVPLTLLFFLILGIVEFRIARSRPNSGWRERIPLYVCAFLLLYIPVSAQSSRGMTSMMRYVLCVQVLLALTIVHLLGRLWPLERRTDARLVRLFTAWCAICFVLQVLFTHRYAFGKWVA